MYKNVQKGTKMYKMYKSVQKMNSFPKCVYFQYVGCCIQDTLSSHACLAFRPSAHEQRSLAYNVQCRSCNDYQSTDAFQIND